MSDDGLQAPDRSHDDYEIACGKCEKVLNIPTVEMRSAVWAALQAQEKKGLIVTRDIHGLLVGD
eukprot:6673206-Pyramimonas_sp.AAC.1